MEILVGSEDLFFKRKQDKENLGRKSKNRQPYEIILVKCEGKTEYYYLHGLREELKLHRENIQITVCKRGTDPMNIVDEALEEYNNGKEYDNVYCLFDKEQSTYQAALNKIEAHKNKNVPIYAITSIPCFDYWLLLHFEATLKPHKQKGRKSSGDQIKSELRKYIKDYREGDKDIFKKIQLNEGAWKKALKRAKQLDKQQEKNDTDDPSTKIYKLVEYLQSLKR
jgi:hypothetical protein